MEDSVWRTWCIEDCVWRNVYGGLGAWRAQYGWLSNRGKKSLASESHSSKYGRKSEKEGMKLTSLAKKDVYLKISKARKKKERKSTAEAG